MLLVSYAFKIFDLVALTSRSTCKDYVRATKSKILKAYCSLVLRSKTTSLIEDFKSIEKNKVFDLKGF